MRALTLIQPWAWAIAHAGKRVENREWQPPDSLFGQRVAIHAGKKFDDRALVWIREETSAQVPTKEEFVHGAIECVATLRGCIALKNFCGRGNGLLTQQEICEAIDSPWFGGPVGWVLADVVALSCPVPCRGAQGLWTLPDDVETEVMRQLVCTQGCHNIDDPDSDYRGCSCEGACPCHDEVRT